MTRFRSIPMAPMRDPTRSKRASRRVVMLGVIGAASLLVAGCGFELRRSPELAFRTIYLSGFKPRSTLADELRRTLSLTTTTLVVDNPTKAEVILESLTDVRDKSVSAPGSAGQVLELELHARFSFRLRNAAGKELIGASEIAQVRDMTFNERDAWGKEQEEEMLYHSMQSDIAAQVLRRLAAVKAL